MDAVAAAAVEAADGDWRSVVDSAGFVDGLTVGDVATGCWGGDFGVIEVGTFRGVGVGRRPRWLCRSGFRCRGADRTGRSNCWQGNWSALGVRDGSWRDYWRCGSGFVGKWTRGWKR